MGVAEQAGHGGFCYSLVFYFQKRFPVGRTSALEKALCGRKSGLLYCDVQYIEISGKLCGRKVSGDVFAAAAECFLCYDVLPACRNRNPADRGTEGGGVDTGQGQEPFGIILYGDAVYMGVSLPVTGQRIFVF